VVLIGGAALIELIIAAVRLGEQCFHDRTCSSNEPHSACIQIRHNAVCQCKPGYHVVVLHKPRDRIFCSEGL